MSCGYKVVEYNQKLSTMITLHSHIDQKEKKKKWKLKRRAIVEREGGIIMKKRRDRRGKRSLHNGDQLRARQL